MNCSIFPLPDARYYFHNKNILIVNDSVVLFYKMPNIIAKVSFKHNLETSIISIAPFTVCFLVRISNIQKCRNAPFLVNSLGMMTLELHKKNTKSDGTCERTILAAERLTPALIDIMLLAGRAE